MQFKHLRTTAALACGGGMIALALTGCNADGKASTIARSVIIDGDPAAADKQLAAIARVTTADIQRVARKYLNDNQSATIDYMPAEMAPKDGPKGDKIAVDRELAQADAGDYDAIVLPGGVINPDQLRLEPKAIDFVRSFAEAGKPIAAICHGPWTLINAEAVEGKKMTSWPSLETDLKNAGAEWVDEEVVVDQGLVTSRKPDDLPAFCAKMIEEFAEGRH